MAATEFNWRPRGSNLIAKFVPDSEIEEGTIAPLNQGEFCAYQENRTYVGTHSDIAPEIKAKRGILARIRGKTPASRDHLFAAQGPHKLQIVVQGEWISGETGTITALVDVTISEHSLGKMFDFASRCTDGEVTPEALASEVQMTIQAKFNSHVMNHANRPTNKKEVENQDSEFENIADEILSGYGCNCTSAILNYMPGRDQNVAEAQKDVNELAALNEEERRRAAVNARHRDAADRANLKAEMTAGAVDKAMASEDMDKAKERLARAIVDSKEDISMAEIEAEGEEQMAQLEMEKQAREARLTKASLKNAKDLADEIEEIEGSGNEE